MHGQQYLCFAPSSVNGHSMNNRDSVALVALLLFIQAGSSHEIFCKVMPGGAADMCFAGKLLCRSA